MLFLVISSCRYTSPASRELYYSQDDVSPSMRIGSLATSLQILFPNC